MWAEAKFFHPAMFERAIDWFNARLPSEPADYAATRRHARELRPELARAKVAVVDLRGLRDGDVGILEEIVDDLPAIQAWPTTKSIRHVGYRSQGETNRDTYGTSWAIESGGAPTPGATPGPSHVVFIADPDRPLPLIAVALWISGHATLVSTRALDDTVLGPTKSIELPYGAVARIRVADVVLPGGRAISADVVVGRGDDVRARAIAVASLIAAGAAPPRAAERRATTSYDLRVVVLPRVLLASGSITIAVTAASAKQRWNASRIIRSPWPLAWSAASPIQMSIARRFGSISPQ